MSFEEEERRRNLRVPLSEQIFVKNVAVSDIVIYPDALDDEGGSIATTVDVSHCGLRLYLQHDVIEGSTLALWVEFAEGVEKLLLMGVVMWSHQSGDGYLVGVKLEENSEADENAWKQLIKFKNIQDSPS